MEPQKIPNSQRNSEKTKQEASHFLISSYPIKLQSSKQYDSGIKTNRPTEQNQEPRNKAEHIWSANT